MAVKTARGERMVRSKYAGVAAAPRSLRRVVPAGELVRARDLVQKWADLELEVSVQREGLVRDLRGRGVSWDSLGWLLGITGSAVRQRYGGQR